MDRVAFQDRIPDNYCFGCGPLNPDGLHIKSFWDGDAAICEWQPWPAHAAGPRNVLNGGIIATIIDCHSICTAIAHTYRVEGREIGTGSLVWCVTGSLTVNYLKPTPLGEPLTLRATIEEATGRKTRVSCLLLSGGVECARGDALAIRVPGEWNRANGHSHAV